MKFDAIVIGAGHNGLTAALHLAQRGSKVLVLEARGELGGLCAAREFHPGYRAPGIHHESAGVSSVVVESLGLERYGLEFRSGVPPVFAPQVGGPGLLLHRNPEAAREEIERHSAADALAYGNWRGFIDRFGGFVRGLMERPPPVPKTESMGDLLGLARPALGLRLLGRQQMSEFLRVLPMCAADWLNEHFETELLCELLAAPGVMGTFLGPWSSGSAFNLLVHEVASGRPVKGGPAALVDALVAACRDRGVEFESESRVSAIRIEQGAVVGVTLSGGEQIDSQQVLSACDPKQTLLQLVHPRHLEAELVQSIRVFRSRGTLAKLHLALTSAPEFAARPGEAFEAVRIGGGRLDALERAFDAVKYGQVSENPHLDVRMPSLSDPTIAPTGHHVLSVLVSFVPHYLRDGWSETSRTALFDRAIEVLERHIPRIRDLVVGHELLTPVDLEREFLLTGGHLSHGEHALDQLLFMRPAPQVSRYSTPVRGLVLASGGSHPGGGVSGLPGWLASR